MWGRHLAVAMCLLAAVSSSWADDFWDGSLDLANLDGANGFVINGIDAEDYSGHSVSGAGDVNDDGIADVIISAYQADPGGASWAGESYVVFGSDGGFAASLDLSSLGGTNGFVINGIDPDDQSGFSVSGAGDVNGDGIADVIIGARSAAPGGSSSAGKSYVVFGSAGGFAASLDLSSLGGTNGFVINGIDAGDQCGFSVSGAGDVNGDGIADVIIGAYYADPGGANAAGESYVVFGSVGGFGASLNLSSVNGTNGFVINGIDAVDYSGYSVSGAGDVNGDGIADVIISAHQAAPGGASYAGESYVVFGSAGGFGASLELSSLNGTNGFVMNGIDAVDWSGKSVSGAGDVNGDGIADVIIGAYGADPGGASYAGESYVAFGSADGFAASLDLSSLGGTNGFVINGIDARDYSGWSVSGAGDVNGDGIADVIIGTWGADPGEASQAGESYVVFGSAGGFGASLDLSSLGGTNGFVINGIDAGDRSGYSVSAAGDVNGDGISDVIIGAYYADPGGFRQAGESYVVFGGSVFTWTPLGGGDFATNGNWLGGTAPATRGVVIIRPDYGGTVSGPGGNVFVDRLTLDADAGVTTLDLPAGGQLVVNDWAAIKSGGKLTGNGTFTVEGKLTNEGEIDLGAGNLEVLIQGDLTLGPSSRIITELASETDFGQLNPTGSVALAGELNVGGYGGYRPKEGDVFAVITAGDGFEGDFAAVISDITSGLPGGMAAFAGGISGTSYEVVFNGFTAGDANGDHRASLGDLSLMAGNWNQSGKMWAEGDFNGDGTVSIGDLCMLAGNWNWQLPASAPVPEPATLSLLALGALAVVRRRRGRSARRRAGRP